MQQPVFSRQGLRETLKSDLRACKVRHKGFIWTALYLFAIPGFLAVFLFRLSAACVHKGIPGKITARLLWRLNVFISMCDIAPEARIGAGLYMPHPMGVIIGAGVVIGENAYILQHSTMGIRNPKDGAMVENSPQLGDNVYVAAGAVICGRIRVGNYSAIGANAVVLNDVPDNAIAIGIPAKNLPRENS